MSIIEEDGVSLEKGSRRIPLLGLPTDILKEIMDKLPIQDRLMLRRTSTQLRDIVDTRNLSLKNIKLFCGQLWVSLELDSQQILYWDHKNNCDIETSTTIRFNGKFYIDMALDDLEFVLQNSRPTLDTLSITLSLESSQHKEYQGLPRLQKFLASLSQCIHVESLKLEGFHLKDVLSTLPYFKPRVLKSLSIFQLQKESEKELNLELIRKISELEQWRQAKHLGFRFGPWEEIQFDCFMNFPKITILDKLKYKYEFAVVKKILTTLPNLLILNVHSSKRLDEFYLLLTNGILSMPGNWRDETKAIYTIPNTDLVFELTCANLNMYKEMSFRKLE